MVSSKVNWEVRKVCVTPVVPTSSSLEDVPGVVVPPVVEGGVEKERVMEVGVSVDGGPELPGSEELSSDDVEGDVEEPELPVDMEPEVEADAEPEPDEEEDPLVPEADDDEGEEEPEEAVPSVR